MISVRQRRRKMLDEVGSLRQWEYCVINLSNSLYARRQLLDPANREFLRHHPAQAIMLGIVEAKKTTGPPVRDHAPFKYVRETLPVRLATELRIAEHGTVSSNLVRRYG